MPPTIHVRIATSTDLPQLMAIDHSATVERVWQLELVRDSRSSQVTASFREVRLPRPSPLVYPNDPFALTDEWAQKTLLLTATAGTQPVGYLAVTEPRPHIAWITDIVVAPRWRQQGIASTMLRQVHEWCSGHDYRRSFMEMQSKNYPAIRLALKHGYEFCGYNDEYYLTKDIAIFFSKVS